MTSQPSPESISEVKKDLSNAIDGMTQVIGEVLRLADASEAIPIVDWTRNGEWLKSQAEQLNAILTKSTFVLGQRDGEAECQPTDLAGARRFLALLDEQLRSAEERCLTSTIERSVRLLDELAGLRHTQGIPQPALTALHEEVSRRRESLETGTLADRAGASEQILADPALLAVIRLASVDEPGEGELDGLCDSVTSEFGYGLLRLLLRGKIASEPTLTGLAPSDVAEAKNPGEEVAAVLVLADNPAVQETPTRPSGVHSLEGDVEEIEKRVSEFSSQPDPIESDLEGRQKPSFLDPAESKADSGTPVALGTVADYRGLSIESNPPPENLGTSLHPSAVESELATEAPPLSLSTTDLAWRCLIGGQVGLACALLEALERFAPNAAHSPASWLFRAVALAPHIRFEAGTIAVSLMDTFQHLNELQTPIAPEISFLLDSAAFLPAILAPGTQSSAVLYLPRKDTGMTELFQFRTLIQSFAERQQRISPEAFEALRSEGTWQSRATTLRKETESWLSQAPDFTFTYAPATFVWKSWFRKGAILEQIFRPVIDSFPSIDEESQRERFKNHTPELLARIRRLRNDATLDAEISQSQVATRKGPRREIEATALHRLRSLRTTALDLAERWITVMESAPGASREHTRQFVFDLRSQLQASGRRTIPELEGFFKSAGSGWARGAASICLATVQQVLSLFDPAAHLDSAEPPIRIILGADLLRVPDLPLDDDWAITWPSDPAPVLRLLQQSAMASQLSWPEAYSEHSKTGDHRATGRIIEYLLASGNTELVAAGILLRDNRVSDVQFWQQRTRSNLDRTRKVLQHAMAFGYLRDQEYLDHHARIQGVDQKLVESDAIDFSALEVQLREISSAIDLKQQERLAATRLRLDSESTKILPGSAAYQRIEDLIKQGDDTTATDYLERALQGQPLPEGRSEDPDRRTSFFPDRAREIDTFLRLDAAVRRLTQSVRARQPVLGYDFTDLSRDRADAMVTLLDAWFRAKGQRQDDPQILQDLFGFLGFRDARLTYSRGGAQGMAWFELRVQPLDNPEICPAAIYGTEARGHYRVLCTTDRPSEESVVTEVGSGRGSSPVIVLYFGRLGERRSRTLSRLCRQRQRALLLIDDILLVHVALSGEPRLRHLFRGALPLTYFQPYTTTAGLVPPEMFFGRQTEMEQIVDPYGTNFIFGGRQLGKTALLRRVELSNHTPLKGQIAIYLDLKGHGIGYSESIERIWELIASQLNKYQVVQKTNTSIENLKKQILDWLDGDGFRRILLLLDEADRFLELDHGDSGSSKPGTEFPQTTQLKHLLETSGRRFKVVFAGLHNVQRTTRLKNHPLAHLGKPICIGPLSEGEDLLSALRMVRDPMRYLGFQFESDDLCARIVSQTNYYPSLIQIYCQHLVEELRRKSAALSDAYYTLPTLVSSKDLEEANQNADLHREIRNRLEWTLQLDDRYDVIANTIAHFYLLDTRQGHVRGFRASEIRREAIAVWPEGFRMGEAESDFQVLLEEMVGLGVLREVNPGYFTLRTPNVLNLMGSSDQILAALTKHRNPPIEYEPSLLRGSLSTNPSTLNPLTFQQESIVWRRQNGVVVVTGSDAVGLADMASYLKASETGERRVEFLDGITDLKGYKRHLDALVERDADSITLLAVADSCPWTLSWLNAAKERISRLTAKNRFARVIHLAGPSTLLGLLPEIGDKDLTELGFELVDLRPWSDVALRVWLDELKFRSTPDERQMLLEASGGFPFLLHQLPSLAPSSADPLAYAEQAEQLRNRQDTQFLLFRALGLQADEVASVLRMLLDLGSADADNLADFMELPIPEVRVLLRYASLLSLVESDQNGYSVTPFVAKLLRASA